MTKTNVKMQEKSVSENKPPNINHLVMRKQAESRMKNSARQK